MHGTETAHLTAAQERRKARIEHLGRATRDEMAVVIDAFNAGQAVQDLRGPETGLVMIRGRMGGTGSQFNLGEATVSRSTIRLSSGVVGHGHRLGTDKQAARMAAILDALGETLEARKAVEDLVDAVARRTAKEDAQRQDETAATRVDFFTMVRGDD